MKDVLLITNYWQFQKEKASNRYLTLANMITESNMNLEVITSTFFHDTKNQRNYKEDFLSSFPYKISLIYERGYSNNISIKRMLSHREFGKNVMKYLKQRKIPDLIYCVVPSLDVAYRVTNCASKENIKVIIDIQDLWPEAYKMVFNLPIISDILFYPLKIKANRIYKNADEIVAVSRTYANRALKVNKKCSKGYSAYLGTDLSLFDKLALEGRPIVKPKDEIWIAYIGTLGYSYDIPSVIEALAILKDRCNLKIKFIVMGDGPLRSQFEKEANEKGIYYKFTGTLDYSEMVSMLCACDIAVNPIVKESVASVINKVADYAAAGLPVINSQDCDEYKKLLSEYRAGLNCISGNPNDIAKNIYKLIQDEDLRKSMGLNNRRLAEEKFDRKVNYQRIVDLIYLT